MKTIALSTIFSAVTLCSAASLRIPNKDKQDVAEEGRHLQASRVLEPQNLGELILNGFQPDKSGDGLQRALETAPLFKQSLLEFCPIRSVDEASSSNFLSESLTEMTSQISSSFGVSGSIGAFEFAVESKFGRSGASSRSSKILKFMMTYIYVSRHISLTTAGLRGHLTDEARSLLDSALPPEEVFDQLGPYYVSSLQFGGQYSFYSSTESKSSFSATQFRAAVMGSRGSIEGSATVGLEVTIGNSNIAVVERQNVLGGSVNKFEFSPSLVPAQWREDEDAWVTSVPDKLAVVDVQLEPVHQLAASRARRAELEKVFIELYSPHGKEENVWSDHLGCYSPQSCVGPAKNGSTLVSNGNLKITGDMFKNSYNLVVNGDLHITGSLYKTTGKIRVNGKLIVDDEMYKNEGEIKVYGGIDVGSHFYKNDNIQIGIGKEAEGGRSEYQNTISKNLNAIDVNEFYETFIEDKATTEWN